MKLRRLQVKNFRCIEDSTEFTICPVTCLVGKNGAGKTSLLEALYKLNPDVEALGNFDVLMEYPRARRRDYQGRAQGQPDDALITAWEIEDKDLAALESTLGAGALKSKAVIIRKGYYPGRRWAGAVGSDPGSSASSDSLLAPSEGGARAEDDFFETHAARLLPKLLYFSEWHIMEGRIAIDALLQRKQRAELTGPDRVFLALLELSGTSIERLASTERSEELIADLEYAARPITEEIARYWSQERDVRVSFLLYPGRPQDPAPFDRGLVFETRIVNTKTNLSLNFEERSTGFIWFFSFLVWYSDVRRRYGENLIILLDDPGLGLHAKAQWDLLRYMHERLAPHYQVLYATHSPFMIDPDRIPWVRTVEEVSQETPEGRLSLGTKVGDEALSTDHDTLLPLQASVGYRIVQDLDGGRRLLLVEKPSDVIYLQWFAARLRERGRTGLGSDWTIVPCGDLTRLATLVGLLARGPSRFAALLSLSHEHPDVAGQPYLARMLNGSGAFPLHKYAEPVEATVEDLLGPVAYPALVDLCYGLPRKLRLSRTLQVDSGTAVLEAVSNHFAAHPPDRMPFHPLAPAEYLLTGSRKLRKLPGIEEALARFERLFTDLG
ncbi:MAG: ATP-binding protein [Planctomycetes bacterium]|nr:ATP-binding protein [Planctomycetota bacterium]